MEPLGMITLLILQNAIVSNEVPKSAIDISMLLSSSSRSVFSKEKQLLATPANLLSHLRNESVFNKVCEGCNIGERGKVCSGNDHGKCDCKTGHATCLCKTNWVGNACQYQASQISCEKMRSCILCKIYGTGPLTEGNDCEHYCNNRYPTPLVVKTLNFQGDEHLCSFIHQNHTVSLSSGSSCRYFFKYGKIKPDGKLDSTKFYILVQQDMDCRQPPKFPQLVSPVIKKQNGTFQTFARNYKEVVKNSENSGEYKKSNFITVMIIYIFIALPVVACVFALIYNFSNLPCGLCNIFRQSSSKYLRNVRPYPGSWVVPTNQTNSL